MVIRFLSSVLVLWTGSLQLGCSACSDDLKAGDPNRADIVLVSIDTLRADHLSSYGYERPTSPFFDQLAADGVRYGFAHSASPWTLPSHTTMLTGQLPMTHRVVEDTLMLSTSTPVLPELLQSQGYATGGFVSTYYVSSLFGFNRGFDHFNDFGITEKTNLKGEVVAEDVVDEALDFYSDQEAGQAVFLFIHLYDVHYSYDPPAPYDTMFDRAPSRNDLRYKNYFHYKKNLPAEDQFEHQIAQYDESIRYVNDQLERIQTAAQEAGREIRFVITSDHGEEFGERGSWGHAHTLYAEQLHVPLIFSGGGLPSGISSDAAVGTQDIAPTLAGWAGVVDSLQPDGLDLAPFMEGAPLPERLLTSETTRFETNRVGLYTDGLRLEWDLKNNREELFDPHVDPSEQTDLSESRPQDLLALEKKLLEALGTPWEAREAGTVRAAHIRMKKGKKSSVPAVILVDRGLQGPKRSRSLKVKPGDRFQVLPYDAEVSFTPSGQDVQGPWQAEGGERPDETNPLKLHIGGVGTGQSALDASQQEALEALGYIQE